MGLRSQLDQVKHDLKGRGIYSVYGTGFFWDDYDEFESFLNEEVDHILGRFENYGYYFLNEVVIGKHYVRTVVTDVLKTEVGVVEGVVLKIDVGYEIDDTIRVFDQLVVDCADSLDAVDCDIVFNWMEEIDRLLEV